MLFFRRALLTMAVETAFFRLARPRDRDFTVLCLLANAVTNLSLNLGLYLLVQGLGLGPGGYRTATALGEALVLAAEYLLYSHFLHPDRRLDWPLLGKTAVANALSLGIGMLVL